MEPTCEAQEYLRNLNLCQRKDKWKLILEHYFLKQISGNVKEKTKNVLLTVIFSLVLADSLGFGVSGVRR